MVNATPWTVAVVAIGFAVLSQAPNLSFDSSTATGLTADLSTLFEPLGLILGFFILVTAGWASINMLGGDAF